MADENPSKITLSNGKTLNIHKRVRSINRIYKTKNLIYKVGGLIIIVLLLLYAMIKVSENMSSFMTVELEDAVGISLCEHIDFENPTDVLRVEVPESLFNISYTSLPLDTINDTDGTHNGQDYIAYTFYIKNVGKKDISYRSYFNISGIEKDLDDAVRIMIIKNGEQVVYARAKTTDGTPEKVYYYDSHALYDIELYTIPFESDKLAFSNVYDDYKVGDIDKYTLVIWLEGSDRECVDAVRGGKIKLEFKFEVVG